MASLEKVHAAVFRAHASRRLDATNPATFDVPYLLLWRVYVKTEWSNLFTQVEDHAVPVWSWLKEFLRLYVSTYLLHSREKMLRLSTCLLAC